MAVQAGFVSDLIGNTEDRFYYVMAHVRRKPVLWLRTLSDKDQAVQSHVHKFNKGFRHKL